MTLDDVAWYPPDAAEVVETPRKCRHPHWTRTPDGAGGWSCACGHAVEGAAARRGRSSRRLGGDQERRIERVYGPRKIGEYGDPVDHIGRIWRWQSKATRTLPPKWLAKISGPTHRESLATPLLAAHAGMDGLYGTRRSVVIRSFVSRGVRARDWLFVHASDAYLEFRIPEGGYLIPWSMRDPGWYVIPGDWWLDHFGRDE